MAFENDPRSRFPNEIERTLPEMFDYLDVEEARFFARLPAWNFTQAVCLSVGAAPDPQLLSWAEQHCAGAQNLAKEPVSRMARELNHRRILIGEAMESGALERSPAPGIFVNWARRWLDYFPKELADTALADIDVEYLLRQQLLAMERIAELKKENDELRIRAEPANRTSEDTLLVMVAAMAVKGFGHDLAKKKQATTALIADAIADLGLSRDPTTILNHMHAAEDRVAKLLSVTSQS